MTYVQPTLGDFRLRYPEFASVADALVTGVLGEAITDVGPTWIEDDRRPAQLALTAHWLVDQGALSGASASGEGYTFVVDGVSYDTAGPITATQVGDVRTTFGKTSASSGGQSGSSNAGSSDPLASTAYGRRYLQLRRRSFPAVLVV